MRGETKENTLYNKRESQFATSFFILSIKVKKLHLDKNYLYISHKRIIFTSN